MPENRWWYDLCLNPSPKAYFREEDRFFFSLLLLIPSVGLLSSWPWWNSQSLFPWWYSLFWSSLLVVICCGLSICYFRFHLIPVTFVPVAPMAWLWHGFMLLYEIYDIDVKTDCESNLTEVESPFIICNWPSGPIWWVLLRDGLCLIHVICLGLVVRTCPTRFSSISAPFNGRPLNSPITMNLRRHQPRSQRRIRRRRRSSFVIHYILIRNGQIRRRQRR